MSAPEQRGVRGRDLLVLHEGGEGVGKGGPEVGHPQGGGGEAIPHPHVLG